MPPLVIDTDVLSFIFRSDTRAALYAPHLFGHVLTISFQTRAEMLRGAISANWGERRRQQLRQWLRKFAVVHSSDELCERWAEALADQDIPSRRRTRGSRPRPYCLTSRWLRTTPGTTPASPA